MKKILSLILVLVMLFSLSSVCFAASATHSHPICGSSCYCSSSHSSSNWTAWDGTTTMYNGNYYLEKDIVLSSTKILNYSYVSYLCLNGHSITCEDTVFDIYSYRSLLITDCKGTGKIETTGDSCTIGNNNMLSIMGGKILNSGNGYGSAINAYSGTNTSISGGRIESANAEAINAYPGCNIQVHGGTVCGDDAAISGHNNDSSNNGTIEISGGTLSSSSKLSTLDIQSGNLIMSGGYVDGDVNVLDSDATATISAGTITGSLSTDNNKTNITGGSMSLWLYEKNANIAAGNFHGDSVFGSENAVVSGGIFNSSDVYLQGNGQTWIYGGYFNKLYAGAALFLSGAPDINYLYVYGPGLVSAQNPDSSGSYVGETVKVRLSHPYSSTNWKDGDVVIKNVKSDAVAQRFVYDGTDSQWKYLERYNNNLVLRELPHGQWGSNVSWGIRNGTLYISGTGAIDYTHSGTEYPWGDYTDEIVKIVVEPGITGIPSYAFEYCENAETIILPDTLTSLSLNAFNDCGSLNNLLLPSSLTAISGMSVSGYSAFIRCESLTDMYYLGTEQQWDTLTGGRDIISYDSTMEKHFLELHTTGAATCTQQGTPAYYQFDDTSVYGSMYDMDKKAISQLDTIPALGHRIDLEAGEQVNMLTVSNTSTAPFVLSDSKYYSDNHAASSSSQLVITARDACSISLNYGVSSEANYDKLYIFYNDTQKDMISGIVTEKTLTLTLAKGDQIVVRYSKDGSVNKNDDNGWVSFTHEPITQTVSADLFEPDCENAVICDYCQTVVKQAMGHSMSDWQTVEEASCTEEGSESRQCGICNKVETRAIEAKGHSYNEVVTAPTCTEQGYTTYTCICGDSYIGDYKDELGHDYKSEITTEPTHLTDGVKTFTCVCGDTYTETIKAEGHIFSQWYTEKASTCEAVGTLRRDCTKCDYYQTDGISALGHSFTSYIYDENATYISDGTKTALCDNGCGMTDTAAAESTRIPLGKTSKISVVPTADSVTLTWEKVEGATGYRVFVRENDSWKQIKKATGALIYTHSGLQQGTKYNYAVRAYINTGAEIIWAPEFTVAKAATTPAVTTALRVSAQSSEYITLNWNEVTGATGYRVFVYNAEAKKWDTVLKATAKTVATISGLNADTTYIFAVRPYINTGTMIVWAPSFQKVTTCTAPAVPVIRLASTAAGRATIAWNNVEGETGYQVYCSESPESGFTKIANYSADVIKAYKTGLDSGKTYFFRIRAYKAYNGGYIYSPFGEVKSVIIK